MKRCFSEKERKTKRRMKRCKRSGGWAEAETETAASKFMSVVNDDLLFEILIRLPDSRSIIQCGTLSPSPCKGGYGTRAGLPYQHLKRHQSYQIYSEKSKTLHHTSPTRGAHYLDFLGWLSRKYFPFIRSSFDDLLLVELTRQDYIICNPLTRRFVALPKAPLLPDAAPKFHRAGLVCESKCNCKSSSLYYCNCSIKFSVVVLSTDQLELIFHAAVFSSETGQWSESAFQFPTERLFYWHSTPVGCSNGVLYWPFGYDKFRGIAAFDLHKEVGDPERCRFISLPREFGLNWRTMSERARIGVVRGGRLRLFQLYWNKRVDSYVFRCWDLDKATTSSSSSWLLVHDLRMKCSNTEDVSWGPVALNPDDEDVFFFTRRSIHENLCVCQYRIGYKDVDECETLFQFPNVRDLENLRLFTLVHPWWPTAIPELPST
ncbi:LOW QUALITY PROTEIN: hypothetical protein TorRG33x02_204870 [Trema orientale]|uniref:F-box protein At3g26010-like beta-propeller domain-containing protein n=1 Tax=Trema orientale TaxID=63057 RepID=A0A2P5EDS1_TREOI|nr:LOW QUALITY PROTEIN: hypothetical protein TorRG33x02_204870 [Trema orientale]